MADWFKAMSFQLGFHAEAPPRPVKSDWEKQNEQAQLSFHKTIDGHYRHGKTGYARVACLFLTWEEDDMQCKETEVGSEMPISSSRPYLIRSRI